MSHFCTLKEFFQVLLAVTSTSFIGRDHSFSLHIGIQLPPIMHILCRKMFFPIFPLFHDQKSSKIEICIAYERLVKLKKPFISTKIPFSFCFRVIWVWQHHASFEVQEGQLVKGLQSFKNLMVKLEIPSFTDALESWNVDILEMSISIHINSYQFVMCIYIYIYIYHYISIYTILIHINSFVFVGCWNSCSTCQTEQGISTCALSDTQKWFYRFTNGIPTATSTRNLILGWIQVTIVNAKPKMKTWAMKSVRQSLPRPLPPRWPWPVPLPQPRKVIPESWSTWSFDFFCWCCLSSSAPGNSIRIPFH